MIFTEQIKNSKQNTISFNLQPQFTKCERFNNKKLDYSPHKPKLQSND